MAKVKQQTCKKGHLFTKSSSCPTCPICEKVKKPKQGFLSLLAAPAVRALQNNKADTLKKLSSFTEKEVLTWHGLGKSSIPILKAALKSNNLSFKKETKKTAKMVLNPEVDIYINTFPPATQKALKQVRSTIQKNATGAIEYIGYKMPAYKLNGKPLVYFAGYAHHIGLYATPTGHKAFAKELAKYKQGKGSVQFPLKEPMPLELIARIVQFRMKE